MRHAFIRALHDKMAADNRIVLLLADVGRFAFNSVFNDFPERAFDLGIREQAIIGMAAGMAKSGLIPVVYGIAPFIVERAYEQIKLDIGYNKQQVIIVTVGASYDYAAEGPTHHCPADVSILSNIPGMEIYAPAFTGEMQGVLGAAIERGKPAYIRLSEMCQPGGIHPPNAGEITFLWGGKYATVLAVGPAVFDTLNALVPKEDVRILYTNRVKPLPDYEFSGKVLIVEPFYPAIRIDGVITKSVAPAVEFATHNERRGVGVTVEQIREAYKDMTDGH